MQDNQAKQQARNQTPQQQGSKQARPPQTTPSNKQGTPVQYNNKVNESLQNPLMDSNLQDHSSFQHQGVEMQNVQIAERPEEQAADVEREEDLKNLIGLLLGQQNLKRMEPGLMLRIQNMEQYYDLLPFNIRGFRLVNTASLLDPTFGDKYILKQTQDLNLDLHKGQFEKHYLIDAALKITKNAPCWSYFTTLIIFTVFLIQLIMDALLIGIFVEKQPEIDAQIEELDSISHTVRDDEKQNQLEDETFAISFLIPLFVLRLLVWAICLICRFIGLKFFRKKYILWTMLLDFIIICLTVIIAGFMTRLEESLKGDNQTAAELYIRNFAIFILFIVAMIQSKKSFSVIKRLSMLYSQSDPSCCNFKAF